MGRAVLETQKEKNVAKIEALGKKIKILNKVIAQQQSFVGSDPTKLQNKIKVLEERNLEKDHKIQQLNKLIASTHELIDRMKGFGQQLKVEKELNAKLKNEIEELKNLNEDEIQRTNESKDSNKADDKGLGKELKSLKRENSELRSENDMIKQTSTMSLDKQVEELKTILQAQKVNNVAKIQALGKKIKKLNKLIQQKQTESEKTNNELEELQEKLKQSNETIENLEKKIKGLEQKTKNAAEEHRRNIAEF